MTKDEIRELIAKSNPNYKACDYELEQIGTDELGLPVFKTVYLNPPTNFKHVRTLEKPKVAILEDLDYVEPTD